MVILINNWLSESIFHDHLKLARVTPIYKDEDKKQFCNYRPISVLNSFSKIYETVLKNRLLSFLDQHNILYLHQYGFRKNHSSYMPIISLIDYITDHLENGMYTVSVFLDFKKAFDSINHDILLYKLNHYGIRGAAYDLIKDYLTNRLQQIIYNNVLSKYQKIETGVPQGSRTPLFSYLY